MPINLAQIRSELLPGLRGVVGLYKDIKPIYSQGIFELGNSRMQQETTTSMRYLGYAQTKTDGGNTAADNNPGERYKYNQVNRGIGLMYAITRDTIDDNLYKAQFNPSNLGMQKSFAQTKDIYGAAIFNNGTILDPNVGGDGQPLYSTVHPVDGNTIPNRPYVDVDLTESSLLAAQASIRQSFRDNANLRMQARFRKLMVPIELEPVAIRLLKTELRPGTDRNDVNAIPLTSGGIPDGYIVNDYLTSKYAWFGLTDIPGLLYLQRIAFEMTMQVDFITDNLLVKAFERFSFGYFDFRSTWGSFPTS